MLTKRCSKCKEHKDRAQFHIARDTTDGLYSWCKGCKAEYAKKWADRNKAKFAREGAETIGNKRCFSCGETKPLKEFYRAKHQKDGRGSRCRACESAKCFAARLTSVVPEGFSRCGKCKALKPLADFATNTTKSRGVESLCRVCSRKTLLRSKYKMSPEDYDTLLIRQDFKCAICKRPHSQEKVLHVDHCHTTKVVRGLLCTRCNFGIGYLQDDQSIMRSAIEYLNKQDLSRTHSSEEPVTPA